MSDRWMLGRAGILNVYQYGDEVLHFAGGRLLLRGVNGSGKSTAMNMLLPFLLDGDTRRIDAAGEQAGVLKSWMLTGRDDAQPVGYLWLELERGDEHVCFGCGIKANRASDTVTTWWWITSRRPGIDMHLVADQRPLSAERLRAELGTDPVYRQDQRAAYRAEIRNRLFAGADIDQHIRLLHIVRNPRVGDRVDVDLPAHLHDALPQLSEQALADAAQPLDELEEHRRNVTELHRTAETLDALVAVYADYARAELRRRSADAEKLATDAERARRAANAARRLADERVAAARDAAQRVGELVALEQRLGTELVALKEAPEYAAGRDLDDLRSLVRRLSRAVGDAREETERRATASTTAAGEARDHAASAGADRDAVGRDLEQLAAAAVEVGLAAHAPDLPAVVTEPLAPDLEGPQRPWDLRPAQLGLEQLLAAVNHRRGDVDDVRRDLAVVDAALVRLSRATDDLEAARNHAVARQEAHAQRRRELEAAAAEWLQAVHEWLAEMAGHAEATGAPVDRAVDPGMTDPAHDPAADLTAVAGTGDLGQDPAARVASLIGALERRAAVAADHHTEALAGLRATEAGQAGAVVEAERTLAELEAVTLPPPPSLGWQRDRRGPVLAEVVDFRAEVAPAERAGLEAALEAAGLLAAEITPDGELAAEDGALLLRPGPAGPRPLTELLRVSEGLADGPDAATVERVLAAISVGDGPQGEAAVGVDGGFRIGPLAGRHRKAEAEHIGGAARTARLQRQRAEARTQLALLTSERDATREVIGVRRAWLAEVRTLRERIPSGGSVTQAQLRAESAGRDAEAAEEAAADRTAAVAAADRDHAEAVDKSRRNAANLGLPPGRPGLDAVERGLHHADVLSRDASRGITAWDRSLLAWERATARWREAVAAQDRAGVDLAAAVTELAPEEARLATIEDAVGAKWEEIRTAVATCETDLGQAGVDLDAARQHQLDAATAEGTARTGAETAERDAADAAGRCVAILPRLRAALGVPGLLDAATTDSGALQGPVEQSPAGVRGLAAALAAHVPAPLRPDASAEGVRKSILARRDTLGAGWDAEDRQPDEALPLAVEVNGPDGRMPLAAAARAVATRATELGALLSAEQDSALRNMLQGWVAQEVADKLFAAGDLVSRMNARLASVTTSHGIGVSLRWRRRDGLDPNVDTMIDLMGKPPDLRDGEEDARLRSALAERLEEARRQHPDAPYRDLVQEVLDYRNWHDVTVLLHRPGQDPAKLTRRTALSEGEKKIVSYLPLFSAVAASCDAMAEDAPGAPRFVLLDDAFAKVSEDNHPKLWGLLVDLDLDVIATSERLWGTHPTVPELSITEVIRDAGLGVIVLEHSRWTAAGGLAAGHG